jgi:hypothetical protein
MSRLFRRQTLSIFRTAPAAAGAVDAALRHARREDYAAADLRIAIETDDPAVTVQTIMAHVLLK